MRGADLRRRRTDLGLSQAALAARLGVTSTTVARWERGERSISLPVAVAAMLDHMISGETLRTATAYGDADDAEGYHPDDNRARAAGATGPSGRS